MNIFTDLTDKELESIYLKHGIKNVGIISEPTWPGNLIINHLDGKNFRYIIPLDNKDEDIENIIIEHINKYSIRKIRKEKLEKLNEKFRM